jgi:hypothetical protein
MRNEREVGIITVLADRGMGMGVCGSGGLGGTILTIVIMRDLRYHRFKERLTEKKGYSIIQHKV